MAREAREGRLGSGGAQVAIANAVADAVADAIAVALAAADAVADAVAVAVAGAGAVAMRARNQLMAMTALSRGWSSVSKRKWRIRPPAVKRARASASAVVAGAVLAGAGAVAARRRKKLQG